MATTTSWNKLISTTGQLSFATFQIARSGEPQVTPRHRTLFLQQADKLRRLSMSLGAQDPGPFPQPYVVNAQKEVDDGIQATDPFNDANNLGLQNAEANEALMILLRQA